MDLIDQLGREIAATREILASELGVAPVEAAAQARLLAEIEIEMRALTATARTSVTSDATKEALLAILAARLGLRIVSLAMDAIGHNIVPDQRGLGDNARVAPRHAKGVSERYLAAVAVVAEAEQRHLGSLSLYLFGQG